MEVSATVIVLLVMTDPFAVIDSGAFVLVVLAIVQFVRSPPPAMVTVPPDLNAVLVQVMPALSATVQPCNVVFVKLYVALSELEAWIVKVCADSVENMDEEKSIVSPDVA